MATSGDAPAKRSTRKVPRVIAGHRRNPHRNREATAIPEGSQIRVANPLKAPNNWPKCPVQKYTAVRASSVIPYRSTGTGPLPTVLLCGSCQIPFHFIISPNFFLRFPVINWIRVNEE
jgi:hypothetical protein